MSTGSPELPAPDDLSYWDGWLYSGGIESVHSHRFDVYGRVDIPIMGRSTFRASPFPDI